MKFGKFGAAAAITATVLVGSLAGATPAQALSFGDTLIFSTDDQVNNGGATLKNIGPGLFEFNIGAIDISQNTTSEFGDAGDDIGNSPITLRQVAADIFELEGTNISFLSGLGDGLDPAGNSRTYTLTSFVLDLTDPVPLPNQMGNFIDNFGFTAEFSGLFNPPTPGVQGAGGLGGFGELKFTSADQGGSISVVPTPAAVLPGLIGMGTAAFRKKKQEKEEESVTAEVKA